VFRIVKRVFDGMRDTDVLLVETGDSVADVGGEVDAAREGDDGQKPFKTTETCAHGCGQSPEEKGESN